MLLHFPWKDLAKFKNMDRIKNTTNKYPSKKTPPNQTTKKLTNQTNKKNQNQTKEPNKTKPERRVGRRNVMGC